MAAIDDDYENTRYIPDSASYPDLWREQAARFRHAHPPRLFRGHDLLEPERAARGLIVLIHGGYWMEIDPSCCSHLAAGGIAAGLGGCNAGLSTGPGGDDFPDWALILGSRFPRLQRRWPVR